MGERVARLKIVHECGEDGGSGRPFKTVVALLIRTGWAEPELTGGGVGVLGQ